MPPQGDEHPSFTPSMIPHSTQDLPSSTLADPAAQIAPPNVFGIDDYDFMFHDGTGSSSSHLPGPESPLFGLFGIDDFLSPADAPEDGRPWSTDADMPGVNAAAAPQAAPPISVGGDGHAAPWSAMAGMAEIQPVEEDAQRRLDSWKSDVEQRLFGQVDPLTVSDEKLVMEAPAPAPASGRDADTAEVNAAIEHVEEDQRRFGSFKSPDLTLAKLRQSTNNFSPNQLLGKGAFGEVYKGDLPNGDVIAVKRFASTITGLQDVLYENEAQHLMRLKHRNILQLRGYCSETKFLLCFEYMPKGSLRNHISDETSGLDWNTRYRIIEGLCDGLRYLHEGQATPIIHMDLKPENILLDDNMVPKIADFGVSRLFGKEQTRTCTTSCKGTRVYLPPEYLHRGEITLKSDVYSFGVMILELITGRKAFPTDEAETTSQQYIEHVLNNWRHRERLDVTPALPCPAAQAPRSSPSRFGENHSPTIASQKLASAGLEDTSPGIQTRSSVSLLAGQGKASIRPTTKSAPCYTSQDIDYQQIKKYIQIGLLCVNSDPAKRPTVNQIIKMVETSDEAYQNEREVAPPVPVGGGGHNAPWCAMACRTEIQHLEEDAQRRLDSWKLSDDEQRLLEEVVRLKPCSFTDESKEVEEDRRGSKRILTCRGLNSPQSPPTPLVWGTNKHGLTVSYEKLVVEAPAPAPAPAPEDGRPSSRDADMAEVNTAATQPGPLPVAACATTSKQKHVLEEEAQRRLGSFMSVVEQDLLPEGHTLIERWNSEADRLTHVWLKGLPERYDMSTDAPPWSMVPFTGPDPKGTKPNQGGWKEKSMKGMRAVPDAPCVMRRVMRHLMPVPGRRRPQQHYLGLKKTLELDDDGDGNKRRAYEYTPLLPSDDGSNKLIPAEISVRFEFKDDEPPSPPPSLKRSRTGAPKDGPKIAPSDVWDHMTRLYVKVTPKDGSKRKKPYYRGMYAICHHCHQVFNADSKQGTNNQSDHLKSCKCNCTLSHSH